MKKIKKDFFWIKKHVENVLNRLGFKNINGSKVVKFLIYQMLTHFI